MTRQITGTTRAVQVRNITEHGEYRTHGAQETWPNTGNSTESGIHIHMENIAENLECGRIGNTGLSSSIMI